MVPFHMYFVTQNVMFPITFLHMIYQETSCFFPVGRVSDSQVDGGTSPGLLAADVLAPASPLFLSATLPKFLHPFPLPHSRCTRRSSYRQNFSDTS